LQEVRALREERSGDVVITAKLDRMFRSGLDALDGLVNLKERGVHMIDFGGDTNRVSKLVFTISRRRRGRARPDTRTHHRGEAR